MTQEQQQEFLAVLEEQFLSHRISPDVFLDLRAVLIERPDDYAESLYWALNPPDHRQFVRFRRRFGPNPSFADAIAFFAEQKRSSTEVEESNLTERKHEQK